MMMRMTTTSAMMKTTKMTTIDPSIAPPGHERLPALEAFAQSQSIAFTHNAPLAARTWYRVGGPAQYLCQPADARAVSLLLEFCHTHHITLRTLGSGANLLVADAGVTGVVCLLDGLSFKQMSVRENVVTVGAGFDLFALINKTVSLGLGGLETLTGVPASIGGAVRMKAGGTFGSIGPLVSAVTTIAHDGTLRRLDREQLRFDYRKSNITEPVIVEVELQLTQGDPEALRGKTLEIMAYKKSVQPMGERSPGCAFKNPSEGPRDPQTGKVFSAGKLLDLAGLKGHRVGNAMVSTHHANFVVAIKGQDVRAADLLECVKQARARVQQQFNVELEQELVTWGFE